MEADMSSNMPAAPLTLHQRLSWFFGCGAATALGCFWTKVLEFLLFLWVARAPFGIVVVGFLLLGAAPQAQDLLIPLVDSAWYKVLLYFVLHFLFWAIPVHYSARIVIADDARLYEYGEDNPSPYFDWLEQWIPRLLGAATFVALLMSAYRANSNLPKLPNKQDQGVTDSLTHSLHYFMVWCLVGLILFLIYAIYRADFARWIGGHWVAKYAALGRPLLNLLDIGKQYSARQLGLGASPGNEFGQLLLIAIFATFVFVLGSKPNQVARWLPGAYSLSLMLGGWLPILTYLSAIGRRLRAPLIVATFTAIALITGIVGDNHDVRLIENSATPTPLRLDKVVDTWMAANQCAKDPNDPKDAKVCPRPVIVAASGGASRAGFFTASMLGELLDKASDHGLDATGLRNRLFAISSVSGSSVGAVMTVAALGGGGPDTKFPCKPTKFSDWYGDDIQNWRGCLESLMSGDFLTPTFIGLTFHDMIPFGPWADRATILEQSWEDTFAAGMDEKKQPGKMPKCSDEPYRLECPFFGLQPTKELWLPLLILNGVSVTTGQRIVTTLLDSTYDATSYDAKASCPTTGEPTKCTLFSETWFFHELLRDQTQSDQWLERLQRVLTSDYQHGAIKNDISLSTAAHNSARFPIVSPPGNIRNQQHFVVDRVVDGGYMENFGVLAAFELAQAVHAVRPELTPFVLVISNDPDEPVTDDPATDKPVPMEPSPDKAGATGYLTDVTSLFAAVSNTRDARGSLAVAQLGDLSRSLTPSACKVGFVHVRVWPERIGPLGNDCKPANFTKNPRAVSMSWWLSTPVQYRLFDEIDGAEICNATRLDAVWKALPMMSDCTPK
jgi:predicted acylesterase/phospholipase RssA